MLGRAKLCLTGQLVNVRFSECGGNFDLMIRGVRSIVLVLIVFARSHRMLVLVSDCPMINVVRSSAR